MDPGSGEVVVVFDLQHIQDMENNPDFLSALTTALVSFPQAEESGVALVRTDEDGSTIGARIYYRSKGGAEIRPQFHNDGFVLDLLEVPDEQEPDNIVKWPLIT